MAAELDSGRVRAALKEIKIPGTNVDILALDLVGDLKVEGGDVRVTVVRTTEKPETIAYVEQAVRSRLAELPGVSRVSVVVDDRAPQAKPTAGPHGHGSDPFADRRRLPGVQKVVAVASAKGGVGKSSVAVNLALALQAGGHSTGLLDADVYGPSIPQMLDLSAPPEVTAERKIIPARAHGLQVISMGLLLPRDEPVIWRGPMVMSAVSQFLGDVQWSDLEYLVVDLPPGTGDAQLTLVQKVPLSGVVMVTTPQEVALADVRRGIQMFRKIEVPILGIVENMSYFVCPGCQQRHDLFGTGGGAAVARQYGLPLLGEIPLDPALRRGGDSGEPAVLAPDSPLREAFLQLAGKVTELAVARDA